MDHQKVTQVLKQIFDIYGVEIVQKQSSFKAAVFDLLDERHYKDEKIVLKHAIECSAIPTLMSAPQITSDAAERAVNEIQKECHMAAEDAEFVVRCMLAAYGIDPDIVAERMQGNDRRQENRRVRKRNSRHG